MTKEELTRELSLIRAQQQPLRRQVIEVGNKTTLLAKRLLDLDDAPEAKMPTGLKT